MRARRQEGVESAGGDSRRVLTGGLGRCANEEEHFPLGAPRLLAVTKYIPIRQKLLACRAGACAYIELLSVHVWTRMPTRSTTSLPTPHGALFLWNMWARWAACTSKPFFSRGQRETPQRARLGHARSREELARRGTDSACAMQEPVSVKRATDIATATLRKTRTHIRPTFPRSAFCPDLHPHLRLRRLLVAVPSECCPSIHRCPQHRPRIL